jgi:hypothetical protein
MKMLGERDEDGQCAHVIDDDCNQEFHYTIDYLAFLTFELLDFLSSEEPSHHSLYHCATFFNDPALVFSESLSYFLCSSISHLLPPSQQLLSQAKDRLMSEKR